MAISTEAIAVSPTIVAATRLEARAVRRAWPGARIVHAGVGLTHARGDELGDVVVSCGLAGGLDIALHTGAVLVPHVVLRPDGEMLECDRALVGVLEQAARHLGYEPEAAPLVTCGTLIVGDARHAWRQRGYTGVDMETGLIRAPRVAAVRVVLDTPGHELDAAWLHPISVVLHPTAWRQLQWVRREAPRCARIAAEIVAAALATA